MDCSQLYKTAHDAYFVDKELDKAISLFNEVITKFPNSHEAQYAENLINQITAEKNGLSPPENQLLDKKASSIAKIVFYIQTKIKFKKIFLVWILLHFFMLGNVLVWETDYFHLENNTFTMAGLIAINLPISAATYYPIDKFELHPRSWFKPLVTS